MFHILTFARFVFFLIEHSSSKGNTADKKKTKISCAVPAAEQTVHHSKFISLSILGTFTYILKCYFFSPENTLTLQTLSKIEFQKFIACYLM